MKIFLLSNGSRVVPFCEALSGRRATVTVVSSDVSALVDVTQKRVSMVCADPATFDFSSLDSPPKENDVLVITEEREELLRPILDHLRETNIPGTRLVFTEAHEKHLRRDYPEVHFRSDRDLFRRDLRDELRHIATLRRMDELRKIASERPHLLIMIWGNPDPDSIGSACALRELLADSVQDISVAYTGEFTRSENRAAAKILKIPMFRFRPDKVPPETTVALVDAQPSFFQPEPPLPFDIVIDHHPVAEGEPPRFTDIRPDYGSTASILTEYFCHLKIPIPKRVATALFLGLKVDTANLSRNVSDADIEAFRRLHILADPDWIRMIELSQMPMAILDHFAYAITHKKMVRDVAFCHLGTLDNPDTCVFIADFLIAVSEISWTVVSCRSGDRIVLVFRTHGYRKHAGKVAESLFLPYGAAGGHRTMARAELQMDKIAGELKLCTDAEIENWLLRKLGERLRPLARLAR